jgi:ATP-dependent Clp protease ATP-binding subunit ClpA
LRREVTQQIENMLATEILKGNLQSGDHVTIVWQDDQYQCNVNKKKESLD